MRWVAGSALCSVMLAARAMAGTVHFDPPSVEIPVGTESVRFDISVSWETLSSIDTVNVDFNPVPIVGLGFDLDSGFANSASWPPYVGSAMPFCPIWGPCYTDLAVGANRLPPLAGWTSPLLMGALIVDTSQLNGGEMARIVVDPIAESDLIGVAISLVMDRNGQQETLSGSATITVVPEAGSLIGLLVVAGGWGLGRGRKLRTPV